MNHTAVIDKISISKDEYLRLKKLDERWGDFLAYVGYLTDINEARKEVTQKKVLPQEKLFKKLGF